MRLPDGRAAVPVVRLIAGRLRGSALIFGLGVAIERWLFFAEARHSVTLYYGQREV